MRLRGLKTVMAFVMMCEIISLLRLKSYLLQCVPIVPVAVVTTFSSLVNGLTGCMDKL